MNEPEVFVETALGKLGSCDGDVVTNVNQSLPRGKFDLTSALVEYIVSVHKTPIPITGS